MPKRSVPKKELGNKPWLRQVCASTLAVVALGLLVVVLITLRYVLSPVDFDGIGKFGFFALLLAPQVFIITLNAALFGWLALRCNAWLAAIAFCWVLVLTATMALWPSFSDWRLARQDNVPLQLTTLILPEMNGSHAHNEKTITYGNAADGSQLVLDLWESQGVPAEKLRPAIVKVHGGAWNYGSRGELEEWNKWFNSIGYDVFDIDYRVPPPVRWKDEVGDVKCALGWVVANAQRYHVDAERISMVGYSAGANLALLASYSLNDPDLPPSCPVDEGKVRCLVNFYGPTDLARLYSTSGSPTFLRPLIDSYVGGPPSAFLDRYRILSPINHLSAHTQPTITFQGEQDRVVPAEQAIILDNALAARGIEHETYLLPWTDHGFDLNWSSIATQIARAKIKAFLQTCS